MRGITRFLEKAALWSMDSNSQPVRPISDYQAHALPHYQDGGLRHGYIRLFKLLPGRGGEAIQGEMVVVSLQDNWLPYTALSYAWGTPAREYVVVCNGQRIPVTKNLHIAMCSLRHHKDSKLLWADGICIDQRNTPFALQERAHQVSMMNAIFAKSFWVMVVFSDIERDLSYLVSVLEHYSKIEDEVLLSNQPVIPPSNGNVDLTDARLWNEFEYLMSRAWFQRLWCLQEYIVSVRVAFLLGAQQVDSFNLHAALIKASLRHTNSLREMIRFGSSSNQADEMASKRAIVSVYRKQRARAELHKTGSVPLSAVWTASRALDVNDERDRVYAIHALLPKNLRIDLAIRYDEPLDNLELRFSKQLIETGYGQWVLMYADEDRISQHSWVLSLRRKHLQHSSQERIARASHELKEFAPSPDHFRACGNTHPAIRMLPNTHKIGVVGGFDDIVINIGPACPPDLGAVDFLRGTRMIDWFTSSLVWLQENGISSTDDQVWRTLTFDMFGGTRSYLDLKDNNDGDTTIRTGFIDFIHALQSPTGNPAQSYQDQLKTGSQNFIASMSQCMQQRSLALTARGQLAAVPSTAEPGDQIAILNGLPPPFVVRRNGAGFALLGSCYVNGIMRGEAVSAYGWSLSEIVIT